MRKSEKHDQTETFRLDWICVLNQMYKMGHFGFTLFLSSLICFLLVKINVIGINMLLVFSMMTAFFSYLPDIDSSIGLKHRGITHTVLFAVAMGIVMLFATPYLGQYFLIGFMEYKTYYPIISAVSVSLAILFHILLDFITFMKFKPLYPFSSREHGGWGITKASSKIGNKLLLSLGFLAYAMSYSYLEGYDLISIIQTFFRAF